MPPNPDRTIQLPLSSPVLREVIFFGTGTSGCVPAVPCLTEHPPQCDVCQSAASQPTQPSPYIYWHKNKRLNTSVMLRCAHPDGRLRNILIDCGKTFYTQAMTWCQEYQLRRLDALLLTHGHADACLGIDDLRQWTLGGVVQDCVDVYLNQETMDFVGGAFPYLVDHTKASGGGDVAGLRFNLLAVEDIKAHGDPCDCQDDIVTQRKAKVYQTINVDGIQIQPFEVEHGKLGCEPYMCLGFRIDGFSYMSDVSAIPLEALSVLKGSDILVVDALHEKPHASHFSIEQALACTRLLCPQFTFLTGFSHRVDHDELYNRTKDLSPSVQPAFDGLRLVLDQNLESEIERLHM